MLIFETQVAWSYHLFLIWNKIAQGTNLPTAHISSQANKRNVYDTDSAYLLTTLIRDIYLYRTSLAYKHSVINLNNQSFYIEVEIDQSGVIVYMDSSKSSFGIRTTNPEVNEWGDVTMFLFAAMKQHSRPPEVIKYEEFLEKNKVPWFNPKQKSTST